MPKPIGFALSLFNTCVCKPARTGSDITFKKRDYYLNGILPPLMVMPDAREAMDAGPIWFWVLLILLLLVLAGYLLYHIRINQILKRRVRTKQQEVAVLFDDAPAGYHSVDSEGRLVNVNRTFLHWVGYDKDELLNKIRFADLVSGDPSETAEKIASVSRSRSGKTDLILIKKNGELLPVILGSFDTEHLKTNGSERLFYTMDNKRCHEAIERTKTLDQELEAFSYSISHDLRAPLRSIDGYSRILQEDYGTQLDDEGKRVLNVVMNNAKRMGKLIDDLLDFGRLGRKPIVSSKVNMTGLVQNIAVELQAQQHPKEINFKIEDLLPASADVDMLRQVWYNLLENAVKYTGKKEGAIIEVRSYPIGPAELCYEVKDNGVGFDMQYSDKLFGMFQRLHKIQDFSGTGVGLAIVKRIITRHGGRVWADGSLKGGATFYFTLLADNENR